MQKAPIHLMDFPLNRSPTVLTYDFTFIIGQMHLVSIYSMFSSCAILIKVSNKLTVRCFYLADSQN